ncbi:hypothetical protein B0H17DRAFT_990381 [Mycena rosella]|uniref:Polyketide synthase-like phosphopantetheine-binding domain-containing protein n=1 Tax=Mycena rosella TaxID=1033263 RepID=A0AAD7G4N5_MYCRO|nr:hypothetical protein B0H17DRAFT_990381 [Mycena rosella]
MQFPTPQGLNSPTFAQPPLDGSLTLPEIFEHHAQHSPDHPLFHYVDADNVSQTISWSRAVEAFHNAARIILDQVKPGSSDPRPVVAILASADQITYFSVIAGILRAGYQAFPISPRNSEVAVAHLLRSTGCTRVFVSADAAMQKLAKAAADTSAVEEKLEILAMPTFEDLFERPDAIAPLPPVEKHGLDEPAVILHSSGSTAFPKTITFTYRILMESGLIPYYGQFDICGEILSVHAVPMFHLMGVVQLPWTTFAGLAISVFPPAFPPVVPTPDRVFDGAVATQSTLMFCVPAFLESWAHDPARLASLKQFKTVIFAGGPLQPAVGDMLVKNGVNIAHVYGLTETSNLTMFLPKSPPTEGWDYFYFSSHADLVFAPLEDNPGVYHLLAKKCDTHTPALLDTVVDGVKALRSNDLLFRHPTNPNLWKVYGRQDDQIMHSTGEKTNPVPIEAILLKNPEIKYAVMFGRSKFHAGVILFPAEPIDPTDIQRVIEFRRKVWPTVEEANRFAPTHSRIFKEMMLIASPSKPIELTPKGTPRRQAMIDLYENEIQEVYAAVDESSQTHLTAPEDYDPSSSLEFVRSIVAEVMVEMPGDDEDIFQHGCDSLQATWIRNSILHALRNSARINIKAVPSTFVYSHPTLRLLADMLVRLASGSVSKPEDVTRRIDVMEAMVQKYAQGFPQHRASSEGPKMQAVLVTGTTGALGSHVIAQLLALPDISTVYAFNRPGSDLRARQRDSCETNGINIQLDSPKLKLLEGDLNLPQFGLSQEDMQTIRKNVTLIIHNAWQVNFNISLPSMEPLVAGTRKLIDFALASPHPSAPRLLFVSTAGVFKNWTGTAPEEPITDARTSVGLGYSESKWVAETILELAAQQTALSPIIVRPGQLSGAANGAWNTTDWFPVLLRASQLLKHLPDLSGRASWVPIHVAASALIEMCDSQDRYLHITHPRPVLVNDIISLLSQALGIPRVPYSEWLASLEADAVQEFAASTNPAVRLLEFFRSYQEVSDEQEAFFPAVLGNTYGIRTASSLQSIAPLSALDVSAWLSYLRQGGYISE